MNEWFYDWNTGVLSLILLVLMAGGLELGVWYGRRNPVPEGPLRDHINFIQGSLLGLLSLLVGFSFSLALQRYDARCAAVAEEAGAMGTAYQLSEVLPSSMQVQIRKELRDYLDLRVFASTLTTVNQPERAILMAKTAKTQASLWSMTMKAVKEEPGPVVLMFVKSLTDLYDTFDKRVAALDLHIPELVLLLLYGTFFATMIIVGYACGVADHRPSLVTHGMVLLIVILVYIIVDLDHPRRGLIRVNQKPLLDLQTSINASPNPLRAPDAGIAVPSGSGLGSSTLPAGTY